MSLRKKMAHGAMWSLVEKAGNQGLSFIVFMFVARFIGPKEYGLANICFVAFSLANLVILGLVDGITARHVLLELGVHGVDPLIERLLAQVFIAAPDFSQASWVRVIRVRQATSCPQPALRTRIQPRSSCRRVASAPTRCV